MGFTIAWHEESRELDSLLNSSGRICCFGNDDGYVLGPSAVVFPALESFSRNINTFFSFNWGEVFTREGQIPPEAPPNMNNSGLMIRGVFHPGLIDYGVPVGYKECVENIVKGKVHEIVE